MVQNSSTLLDCEHESVEENPRMLAFFDSLVQRDLSSDETETDNELMPDIANSSQWDIFTSFCHVYNTFLYLKKKFKIVRFCFMLSSI